MKLALCVIAGWVAAGGWLLAVFADGWLYERRFRAHYNRTVGKRPKPSPERTAWLATLPAHRYSRSETGRYYHAVEVCQACRD